MKTTFCIGVAALPLVAFTVSLGWGIPIEQETNKSLPDKPAQENIVSPKDEFAPVEDMHHFMEYVCEPSYKGLKAVLASEPENRQAWKAFKNHALVLAETSALVAARAPEGDTKARKWKQMSLGVYKSGTALYKSAGNYDEAKKHYGLMLDQCNQCHTEFAEGKHQLAK